ncbi:hypothetical protein [Pelagibius sp.]
MADYLKHRQLDPHPVQDMLAAHLDRRRDRMSGAEHDDPSLKERTKES